jgi:DNA-damage-inducible protein J
MAGKTAFVRARTEPELKRRAEAILHQLGLTPSAAINMFYRQIILRQSLPFEVVLPNKSTREAMKDARSDRELIEARTVDDLIAELDSED